MKKIAIIGAGNDTRITKEMLTPTIGDHSVTFVSDDPNITFTPTSQFKIEPLDVQMPGKESRRLRRKQQRKNKK